MGPEVDVGALAAGGGLLELDLGLLLVLNLYLYSGFLGIALRDLGKRIVVSRVARPDGKERINGAVFFCKAAARTILFICFISETDCPAALGGASLILAIRSEVRTSAADPGLAKAHCTSEGAGY